MTSPSPFGGNGTSRFSGSGRWFAGSGPMTVSAALRMRAPLRKLVNSGSRGAGDPSLHENTVGKSSRFDKAAPRHA